MVFVKAQGRHTQILQQLHETTRIVLRKHPHKRHIQRTFNRHVCRNGSLKLLVIILRTKALNVQRNIRHQRTGQQGSILQQTGIEKGFQQTARTAWCLDHIHLRPPSAVQQIRGVAHVSQHLPCLDISHQRRYIIYMVRSILPGIPVDDGCCLTLERSLQRSGKTSARPLGRQCLHQVRRFVGKRHRFVRQGLQTGQRIIFGRQDASIPQSSQEPVALGLQLLPVPSRMHQRRGIGQHGQQRTLGPRQLRSRPAEITPGSRLHAHHIAAERGMGSIQAQQLLLGIVSLQTEGPAQFQALLPNRTRLVSTGYTRQLHRQCAASAHHTLLLQVLSAGTRQRPQIDARMVVETFVFESDQAGGKLGRNRIGRRKTPLPVRCNPSPQQLLLG